MVAAILVAITSLTVTAGRASADTPTIAGACTFGPTSGTAPLTLTMTASTLAISGSGACRDNIDTSTVTIAFSGYGTFTCAGGVGSLGGQISWSTGIPGTQGATYVRAVVEPNTVTLEIEGSTGFLEATAQLAWNNPTADATCATTGTLTTGLTGTMTYASS